MVDVYCDFSESVTCRWCGYSSAGLMPPVFRICGTVASAPKIFSLDEPDFNFDLVVDPVVTHANHSDFPCPHRGEVKSEVGCSACGGRGQTVAIYHCKHPEIEAGACTIHAHAIRNGGPTEPLLPVCISCDYRDPPGSDHRSPAGRE